MLLNSMKMQITGMMRKKAVKITFCILFAFVIVNYFVNMINYYEVQYVSQMHDPIKVLTLSTWSISGYFMMQFYPILVVIPTASEYFVDKETRVKIYVESKIGRKNYWYSKGIAVFLVTFIIFTLPFFIELLLEGVCFSLEATGDPSGFQYIQTIENERRHIFYPLFLKHKFLYAMLMTVLFGLVSGVLALFNFSISTLAFIKYKIFTFIPIYVLFYLLLIMEQLLGAGYTFNYFHILRLFNSQPKNYFCYMIFLLVLVISSCIILRIKTLKDDLL